VPPKELNELLAALGLLSFYAMDSGLGTQQADFLQGQDQQ
jgi:hypothetical protein